MPPFFTYSTYHKSQVISNRTLKTIWNPILFEINPSSPCTEKYHEIVKCLNPVGLHSTHSKHSQPRREDPEACSQSVFCCRPDSCTSRLTHRWLPTVSPASQSSTWSSPPGAPSLLHSSWGPRPHLRERCGSQFTSTLQQCLRFHSSFRIKCYFTFIFFQCSQCWFTLETKTSTELRLKTNLKIMLMSKGTFYWIDINLNGIKVQLLYFAGCFSLRWYWGMVTDTVCPQMKAKVNGKRFYFWCENHQ